jgi:hypothetical protein
VPADAKKLYYRIELRFIPCGSATPVMTQLVKSPVAVEKGTKAVISVNFSSHGKRRFNDLRANFVREIPRKEFFNTHAC